MNKYKRLIVFLGVLFILIWLIQSSMDILYKKRSHQKFGKIFSHQVDKQVMIFGSSVAYHHFVPEIISKQTNLSAYNMGWDGTFFVQYSSLIKEYLSYEKECRYIILGCDFDNLDKNPLISRPDLYYAYLSNEYVYQSLHEIEPQKIWRAKYLPGYKLTLLNSPFYKAIFFPGSKIDTTNGYDAVITDSFQVRSDTAFNARYNDRIFNDLKTTIDEITKKGIKVIIVMTPVYKDGYKLILNADMIKDKYKSLTNKDVLFLDFTADSIDTNKSYFYNYSHLNSKGATVFSAEFADSLSKIMNQP